MKTMMKARSVLLVENHSLFREALAWLIDQEPGMKVTAQTGTISEDSGNLLEEVDVVVVGLDPTTEEGTSLLEWLRERAPHVSVLALTMREDQARQHRATRDSAAQRVLSKTVACSEILGTLRDLCRANARAV